MIINEIYTIVLVILKVNGDLDWSWTAILAPELVWLCVYAVCIILVAIAVHTAKPDPNEISKEDWRGLD